MVGTLNVAWTAGLTIVLRQLDQANLESGVVKVNWRMGSSEDGEKSAEESWSMMR